MLRLVVALSLTACDTTIDWFVDGEADYGRVYECHSGASCPESEEWCWNASEEELEQLLGAPCEPTGRLWPAVVGCAYDCSGRLTGPGANAHCGTACRP